jgi:nucleotide-binding universal stress UspA family protein
VNSPAPASDLSIDSVLHPTDRSEASLSAFYHALALAAHSGADLTLLHSQGRRSTDSFKGFPTVRATIAKWRTRGMARSIEQKLARWQVFKLEAESRDPVAASMEHLFRHEIGFIVMATEGPDGSTRLVQPARAARLARLSRRVSLFVPHGCRPFVSGATGEVWLRRILVPIDGDTDPRPAVLHALRSVALVDDPALEITLLQLGKDDPPFLADLPDLPFCKWASVRRSGEPAAQILGLAQEVRADAIYMPTAGGWQAPASPYRGVTEAVIQGTRCPVATIPGERMQPMDRGYRDDDARSGWHAA